MTSKNKKILVSGCALLTIADILLVMFAPPEVAFGINLLGCLVLPLCLFFT